MLLKKAKYKKVREWRSKLISPEVYGCDECYTEIKDYPNESNCLKVDVFHKDREDNSDLHFCSWDCALKHLPKIKTKWFVALPNLLYDTSSDNKRGAKHLINLLNQKVKAK